MARRDRAVRILARLFVAASAVLSRDVDRAYDDPGYARRSFKLEVAFSLFYAAMFVVLAIVLLVIVLVQAVAGR